MEVWSLGVPAPGRAAALAESVEGAGWDGLCFTDSQNLTGDVYAGLAVAARATERIGRAAGVTHPVTRHPAASAIASIQVMSNGRAGIDLIVVARASIDADRREAERSRELFTKEVLPALQAH